MQKNIINLYSTKMEIEYRKKGTSKICQRIVKAFFKVNFLTYI